MPKDKKDKSEKEEVKEGEVKLQGVEDWEPGPLYEYEQLLERLFKIIEDPAN